jgi:hypothetical protein
MQSSILYIHSILRWVLLILLIVSIVKSFTGWQGKKTLSGSDRKLFLFTLISAHLNFLVGIYLLLFGTFGVISGGLPAGVELHEKQIFPVFLG